VCFFGLIRNLDHSLSSINSELLSPIHEAVQGALDVFVHTMLVPQLADEHSKGKQRRGPWRQPTALQRTSLQATDFLRLRPCKFASESQTLVDWDYQLKERARASWAERDVNNFYSVDDFINIYRSKYSLNQAAKLVIAHESSLGFMYTHVVAARPDTIFLSPLVWRPLEPSGIRVPNYLHWGGVNDRLAYGDHASMLFAYMNQFEYMYRQRILRLITSEELLCKHLTRHQVRVGVTPICNVRVRSSGIIEAIDMKYEPSWPEECCDLRFVADNTSDDLRTCPPVSNMCGYINDPQRCIETFGAPNKSTCRLRRGLSCDPCLKRNELALG